MCIVPVHAQGFACTKSYCLVIGAQGCEQFAQSHAAIPKPEVKRTTFWPQVQRPIPCITMPPYKKLPKNENRDTEEI